MRILHVVTLQSPDGAFGGPVRVAGNQAAALRAQGHDVSLAAGQRGYGGSPPSELDGSRLHGFPVRAVLPGTGSFSALTSPAMHRWLWRILPRVDVLHVHLARDLITLPAAWLARRRGVPYVVQPHGMVIESGNPLAGPLDALLTRDVLRGAGAVLHLTEAERRSLQSVAGPDLALHSLRNGVPLAPDPPPLPQPPQVLFCARLHRRKRPLVFVEMARRLLAEGVDAEFVLVGPDEGEGTAVRAALAATGAGDELRWEGALDPARTLARMRQASLVVLPSVNEPYPMTVLEALAVGRPVVVGETCGLAEAVRQHGCGGVVGDDVEELVTAVRQLLGEPDVLRAMSSRALRAARQEFAMEVVADRLLELYADAVGRTRSR